MYPNAVLIHHEPQRAIIYPTVCLSDARLSWLRNELTNCTAPISCCLFFSSAMFYLYLKNADCYYIKTDANELFLWLDDFSNKNQNTACTCASKKVLKFDTLLNKLLLRGVYCSWTNDIICFRKYISFSSLTQFRCHL